MEGKTKQCRQQHGFLGSPWKLFGEVLPAGQWVALCAAKFFRNILLHASLRLIKMCVMLFIVCFSFSALISPWLPGWKLYPLIIHIPTQTDSTAHALLSEGLPPVKNLWLGNSLKCALCSHTRIGNGYI